MTEYRLTIVEDDGRERTAITDMMPLADPFIRTLIRPRGWRLAWALLRGKLEYRIVLDGNKEATAYVMNRAREMDRVNPSDLDSGADDERTARTDIPAGTDCTNYA